MKKTKKKAASKSSKAPQNDDILLPEGYLCDIPSEQYWEWRTSLSEYELARERHQHAITLSRLMALEIEKKKADLKLYNHGPLSRAKDEAEKLKLERTKTKEKIEKALGHSLEGAIINEALQLIEDKPQVEEPLNVDKDVKD